MISIFKKSKIYIFSPGNFASGGPEALHQLYHYLHKLEYDVYMCYFGETQIHPKYFRYEPRLVNDTTIEDIPSNVVIVPESSTSILKRFLDVQKCIWWLGVQCYDGGTPFTDNIKSSFKMKLKDLIPRQILQLRLSIYRKFFQEKYKHIPYVISNRDINLCGSEFAFRYTYQRFRNVHLFVEPLGLRFLDKPAPDLTSLNRSNKVLYNPAKPSLVMDKLLARNDIEFTPLSGYSEDELITIFRKSKLYVDFGVFGGPERLPKETVFNGTMLLVANRNAAKNGFDVAIPKKFKIDNFNDDIKIAQIIKEMINDYDSFIGEFAPFRMKIEKLEEVFIADIKKYFLRCEQPLD